MDGGSGNCTVKVYDTDKPNQLPLGSLRESLATTAANTTARTFVHGFSVKAGAYVELAARTPRRSSSSAPSRAMRHNTFTGGH